MLESVKFVLAALGPSDWVWLGVSLVLATISAGAFRRRRGVDTSLLLIGSSALVAKAVFWNLFMGLVGEYRFVHPTSAFAGLFYPGHASAPWTHVVALTLLAISMLWPLGALAYLLRMARTHLTRRWSERPPAARLRFE